MSTACALALLCFAAPNASGAVIQIETIVLSDTDGPLGPQLGPGVYFASFAGASGNNIGDLVLQATLSGAVTTTDDQGIWMADAGSVTPIARVGDDGPLGPGQGPAIRFRRYNLNKPTINNHAEVAFAGATNGPDGVWLNTGSGNAPIALEDTDGPLGPGLGSGVEFISTLSGGHLTDAGQVVFSHYVNQTDPILGGQQGIWETTPTGPSILARVDTTSNLGPGFGDDTEFSSVDRLYAGASGDITALMRLNNPTTGFIGRGVFDIAAAGHTVWAMSGTDGPLGPQLGPGVQFGLINTFESRPDVVPVIATVIGTGVTTDNQDGAWLVTASGAEPVARSDSDGALGPNLGPGVVFGPGDPFNVTNATFLSASSNATSAALIGRLASPSHDPDLDFGVWVGDGLGLTPVALTQTTGPLGPGLGPSTVFTYIHRLTLNDDGSLFFAAELGAPGDMFGDESIWAYAHGSLHPLLIEGQQIAPDPSAPGILKTVSGLTPSFVDTANNQWAVEVRFVEGGRGLFRFGVSEIPEPTTLAVFTAAGLLALCRRRNHPSRNQQTAPVSPG